MSTAYVYSPFTGTISQGPGCNSNHVVCGEGSSPVDIAGLGTIRLYVNYPTVKYIYVQINNLCCDVTGANADHRRTIKVDLYSASYCKFGSVVYGHVRNPAVGNGWRTLTSSSTVLGETVSVFHNICYQGIHIHMEGRL